MRKKKTGLENLAEELNNLPEEIEGEEVNGNGTKSKEKKVQTLARAFKLISSLTARLQGIDNKLRKHINEPSATIMVLGSKGAWEEWTGSFELDKDEKLDMLINKIEKHFDWHFKKKNSDKKFALFVTEAGEKNLHKLLN